MDRLTHLLSYLLTYLLTHLLTYSLIDYTSPYEDTDDDGSCCCGWVTKAHLETFLYWAILCCVRRRDARRNIKYSNYKPLQKKRSNQQDDDYDDGPLTYSLTHSLTHLLTHSLTHSLIYLLTHSLIYLLTHLLAYSTGDDDDDVGPADKDYEKGQWLRNVFNFGT